MDDRTGSSESQSPQLVTFALATALKDGYVDITITKAQNGTWTLQGK